MQNDRAALTASLVETQQEISSYFEALDLDLLYQAPTEGVWSPAEHLVHLIKTVKAISQALRKPRIALWLLFGRTHAGSRSYDEIVEAYQARLAAGGKAPAPYVPSIPQIENPDQGHALRERILSGWTRESDVLATAVGTWNEQDLDRYRLPHPLLGKLTLREIVQFTIYHNRHHLKSASAR